MKVTKTILERPLGMICQEFSLYVDSCPKIECDNDSEDCKECLK